MPCRDDLPELEARKTYERLNRATRLLCAMIKYFGPIPGDAETAAWEAEHDEMDRRREAAERSRQERQAEEDRVRALAVSAVSKLTNEEIEAIKKYGR